VNAVLTSVWGITGGLLGFMIPVITKKISAYKCRKKGIARERKEDLDSLFIRLTVCLCNAVLWALAGYRMTNILSSLLVSFLFSLAFAVALTDWQIRIIPNELVLAMFVSGLGLQTTIGGQHALLLSLLSMAGMILLFTAVAAITGFRMIGAGDMKLAGAMGAALGYPHLLVALMVMSAALFLYGSIGLLTKRLTLISTFAFAPFMMLGTVVSLIRIIFL
jgi:leader peptidase (prepilin peptidase)/N-methyltransferase